MGWYPKRRHYYLQKPDSGEEIEQGDIFWGVPVLVARHPDLANRFEPPLAELPTAESLEPPPLSRVVEGVGVLADPVMVLPHTCDFYGPEKGKRNRERLVGRIQRLADAGITGVTDLEAARSGEGFNHTFFLPSWANTSRDVDDMIVNFRFMTTADAAYLSRTRRVARLSHSALIALRRRLAHFFTDYAPAPKELETADGLGGLIRNDRDLKI